MLRIIPLIALLFAVGCSRTSAEVDSQPKAEASAQSPATAAATQQDSRDAIAELLKEADVEERALISVIAGRVERAKHTDLANLLREFAGVCESWKSSHPEYYQRVADPGYPLERIQVTDSLRTKAEALGYDMSAVHRMHTMLEVLLAGPNT